MKRIPNFNQFLTESSINETVYNSGLGGDLVYSKTGDSSIKRKTIGILKSKKWMKTQVGKNMLDEADRLANMWKERNPSTWPTHFKDYEKDADGFVKPSNFIKATGLIVCVLDEISKRENATWVDAKLRRGHCFGNATEWAFKNEAKTIGGIIIETGNLNTLSTESLVVHAFCEKGNNYYEVTIPTAGRTAGVIYWPLITYSNPNEMKVAEETWSYALGIEEGTNEYLNSL